MPFVCVCREGQENIFLDGEEYKEKRVAEICANLEITNLWIRTPFHIRPLERQEQPGKLYSHLFLDNRCGDYARPEYCLYVPLKTVPETAYIAFTVVDGSERNVPPIYILFEKATLLHATVREIADKIEEGAFPGGKVIEIFTRERTLDDKEKIGEYVNFARPKSLFAKVEKSEKMKSQEKIREGKIKELIDTEQSYVDKLDCLNRWRIYMTETKLFSESEYQLCFRGVADMFEFHSNFYKEIQSFSYADCVSIPFLVLDGFQKSSDFIKRNRLIQQCLEQKEAALKELQLFYKLKFSLSELQIEPLQRLVRYGLLLKDICSVTPQTHPDSEFLQKALEGIERLNFEVDRGANAQTLEQIQLWLSEKLKSEEVPKSNLLWREPVYYNCHPKKQAIMKEGQLFCYEDTILLLKRDTKHLAFRLPAATFNYRQKPDDLKTIFVRSYTKELLRTEETIIKVTFENVQKAADFVEHLRNIDQMLENCNDRSLEWCVCPLSDSVPPLCEHAAMGNGQVIVFFGGMLTDGELSMGILTYECPRLGELDMHQITMHSTTAGRRGHTVTFMNGYIYIVGGLSASDKTMVVRMDLKDGSFSPVCKSAPFDRYGHTCIGFNDKLYVFGGKSSKGLHNEVCVISPSSGIEVLHLEGGPEARANHSAVLYNDRMIIHGGEGKSGKLLSDVWEFDFGSHTWKKVELSYSLLPRKGHQAFLIGNEMLIVGGVGPENVSTVSSISIDLEKEEVFRVTDIGNAPPRLHSFCGGILSSGDIVLYGGREPPNPNPQSTVYVVHINPKWNATNSANSTNLMSTSDWNSVLNSNVCYTVVAHQSTWIPPQNSKQQKGNDDQLIVKGRAHPALMTRRATLWNAAKGTIEDLLPASTTKANIWNLRRMTSNDIEQPELSRPNSPLVASEVSDNEHPQDDSLATARLTIKKSKSARPASCEYVRPTSLLFAGSESVSRESEEKQNNGGETISWVPEMFLEEDGSAQNKSEQMNIEQFHPKDTKSQKPESTLSAPGSERISFSSPKKTRIGQISYSDRQDVGVRDVSSPKGKESAFAVSQRIGSPRFRMMRRRSTVYNSCREPTLRDTTGHSVIADGRNTNSRQTNVISGGQRPTAVNSTKRKIRTKAYRTDEEGLMDKQQTRLTERVTSNAQNPETKMRAVRKEGRVPGNQQRRTQTLVSRRIEEEKRVPENQKQTLASRRIDQQRRVTENQEGRIHSSVGRRTEEQRRIPGNQTQIQTLVSRRTEEQRRIPGNQTQIQTSISHSVGEEKCIPDNQEGQAHSVTGKQERVLHTGVPRNSERKSKIGGDGHIHFSIELQLAGRSYEDTVECIA